MNSLSALTAHDTEATRRFSDDDIPEAPDCWSLDDFADILGGQR